MKAKKKCNKDVVNLPPAKYDGRRRHRSRHSLGSPRRRCRPLTSSTSIATSLSSSCWLFYRRFVSFLGSSFAVSLRAFPRFIDANFFSPSFGPESKWVRLLETALFRRRRRYRRYRYRRRQRCHRWRHCHRW